MNNPRLAYNHVTRLKNIKFQYITNLEFQACGTKLAQAKAFFSQLVYIISSSVQNQQAYLENPFLFKHIL